MKFSVPTNWQPELIQALNVESADEVYGKLRDDPIGGCRNSYSLPFISRHNTQAYISQLHKKRIGFNYVLNSICLNNYEWTKSGQKQIRDFLAWLVEIGVDSVTVSIPYLLEMIKKNYPSLKVVVSTMAGVDSLGKVKYWECLGADEITLSSIRVNRNFPLLKKIKQEAKCKLRLIANECCLYQCPFRPYHAAIGSHGTQSQHYLKGFLIDYPNLSCNYKKLLSPFELIRSPWIRPEDLQHYEAIGIERIKLIDRAMSTPVLISIYNAYVNRSYEGNLFDLFLSADKTLILEKPKLLHKLKYFFRPFTVNILKLIKLKELIVQDVFYIENRDLDDFILHFINNDCSLTLCEDCRYCYKIADRVVKINQDKRLCLIKKYEKYLDELVSGGMFRYP
jgi:collagenase-like PrtC family protease